MIARPSAGAVLRAARRCLCTGGEAPKLWGGRFTGATDPLMEKFNESLSFDRRMWREDIQGSKAYANALARAGIISAQECEQLASGLTAVEAEWAADAFVAQPSDEDIHTANERRLTEIIGATAGKLHTGRSRNDQVATDIRLWLRGRVTDMQGHMLQLIDTTTQRAKVEVDLLMPGYTHLQPAQPVRWSHWLLSHACAWQRDAERLQDLQRRVDMMPLGSGAIAGHAFFGVDDRKLLAEELGFKGGPTTNSMDSVSDRDFAVEFMFWASLTGVHLSRWAEDVIIYASNEFGYVKLSDAYSTGSSLMPQKKNPDALELLRGKAGRNVGGMVSLLTTMKGIPTTYNKDMQEDKEPLFDAVDTMAGCLPIAAGVMATLEPKPERMLSSLSADMLATDLADYLVRAGVPFRETHHVAGRAVQLAEDTGRSLTELSADELRSLHPDFGNDVLKVTSDFTNSVESRDAQGGTSRRAVLEQVEAMEQWTVDYKERNEL